MAGKIRGITIELSADATGVLDAVKNVNSELSSTGKQLKDVEKLLKMDPGNMDLLKQKTQMLQEQIGNCKEKLETLKQAQADMDANGVDKNSEQYQALQREIIATEQELKKLESTSGSGSAALAKVSQVTGEIGSKMENAGKKMSVVSAAVAALGTAAIAAFKEVDTGADTVIKKTGATGEAADQLKDSYKNVAKEIVGDFGDIGAAVGEVNTRFGSTGEDLEKLSKKFLKFAEINDTDVSSSVDKVQKALSAFGLDADNAESLLDRLTLTSQQTGISVDTLSEGLVKNGTAFEEMGLNIDQAVVLMGQMETSGANMDAVMQGLQKALKNATEDGVPLNQALSDLQDTILNGKDGVDGLTAAYDLFGKSGAQIYTAIKNGTLDFANLAIAADDAAGAVDNTYEATKDGTDKMALAWQNLKIALSELGEAIGRVLAPIMEKITGFIQGVSDWFSGLDEGSQNTIVTIGLLVTAIGPLLVVGGKVLSGISSITSALSAIGTSSAGPIGLVIAAVAAAAAGVAILASAFQNASHESNPYKEQLEGLAKAHNDYITARDNAKSSYENTMADAESSAAAAVYLTEKLQEMVAAYDGSTSQSEAIQAMVNQLNELVPGLALSWDGVTGALSLTNDEIYANIEAMKQQAQTAALQDYYTESLKANYEAQKNAAEAQKIMNDLCSEYGITMDQLNYVMSDTNQMGARLKEVTDGATGSTIQSREAANHLKEAYDALNDCQNDVNESGETVAWIEGELGRIMSETAETTKASTSTIESACKEAFGGNIPKELNIAIEAAKKAGVDIPQSLIDGIKNGEVSVSEACKQLAELTNQAEQAQTEAKETADAYVDQMEQAINDGADDIEDAAQNVVDELDQSDDAYSYGEDAGSSFDQGLGSQEGNIQGTAENIASDVNAAMENLPGDMNSTGDSSGSNLNSAFGGWSDVVWATVDDMYEIFYSSLGVDLPNNMLDWGDSAGKKFDYGISGWTGTITATASGIADAVYNSLSVLSGWLESAGYNAGQGLYNGLATWQYVLSDLAWSIANNINTAARAALQIQSPSRVMMEIGENVGAGLEKGIEKSGENAISAAEQLAGSMAGAMDGLQFMNSSINANVHNTGSPAGTMADSQVAGIMQMLNNYLPYLAAEKDIHFDDGAWAGKLAPAMREEFGKQNVREARG